MRCAPEISAAASGSMKPAMVMRSSRICSTGASWIGSWCASRLRKRRTSSRRRWSCFRRVSEARERVDDPRLPERRLVAPQRVSRDTPVRQADPQSEARGCDHSIRRRVRFPATVQRPDGVVDRTTFPVQQADAGVVPPVVPPPTAERVVHRVPHEDLETPDGAPERSRQFGVPRVQPRGEVGTPGVATAVPLEPRCTQQAREGRECSRIDHEHTPEDDDCPRSPAVPNGPGALPVHPTQPAVMYQVPDQARAASGSAGSVPSSPASAASGSSASAGVAEGVPAPTGCSASSAAKSSSSICCSRSSRPIS